MTGPFLAVDAGGSHTRAVVRGSGGITGTGLAGPANWTALGPQQSTAAIAEAAGHALRAAGQPPDQIIRACVALAGYYPPWHEAEVRAALTEALFGAALHLVPDLVAAWAGATGGEAGIVLVAGTGAVAYGRDPGGRTARAGGWGPLFGDEGGGYWIGCEVLRAASRSLDGRGPASSLIEAIRQPLVDQPCNASGVGRTAGSPPCSGEEALRAVYRDRWTRARVAELSAAAGLHAAAGDRVATEILERAAGELGALIAAVAGRLGWHAGLLPVYAVGGVTEAGPALIGPLERWLAAVLPPARFRTPLGSPLDGALLLARQEELT